MPQPAQHGGGEAADISALNHGQPFVETVSE